MKCAHDSISDIRSDLDRHGEDRAAVDRPGLTLATVCNDPERGNRRDPAARLAATGPRALLKHTPSHLNTAILVYPLSNLYLPNPSISYVSSIPHSHPLAHVAAAHVLSSILATTGLARKDSAMWTGNAPGMAESHGIYAKY